MRNLALASLLGAGAVFIATGQPVHVCGSTPDAPCSVTSAPHALPASATVFFSMSGIQSSEDAVFVNFPTTMGEACQVLPSATHDQGLVKHRLTPVDIDMTACAAGFSVTSPPGQEWRLERHPALALSAETATPLTAGVPAQGSVSGGHYVYYEFPAPHPPQDVYFDVTPLAIGDPDVFVACAEHKELTGTEAGTPSSARTHHAWGSVSIGVDTVSIPAGADGYCAGSFIAGMTAFGPFVGNFSVVVTTAEHKYVELYDGQPQSGSVQQHHMAYFQFPLPNPADRPIIAISLTSSVGDADMYVNVGNTDPTGQDWAYRGVSSGSSENLRIMPDKSTCPLQDNPMCYCPAAGPCTVTIALYGYTTAQFTLQVTTNDVEQSLQDNSPVLGSVEGGQYSFFKFYVPNLPHLETNYRLVVSASKLVGDPDVFVSRNYENPTAATYAAHPTEVWDSVEVGNSQVILTGASLSHGTWHIGVLGFGNTTFSIMAAVQEVGGTAINGLLPGSPQTGEVENGQWQYYGFTVDFDEGAVQDVRFTLTPLEAGSEMLMYVLSCPAALESGVCAQYLPSEHRYNVTSQHTASVELVQIHADSPHACTSCSYIVGVRSIIGGLFSISGATGLLPLVLRSSLPVQDIISEHAYHYFAYVVQEPGQDVVISATPQNGDVDLLVTACGYIDGVYNGGSCNHAPNMTSYTWASFGFGNDSVVIPTGDSRRCQPRLGLPCVYAVGVFGYSAASYSLLARLHDDDPVPLQQGQPVSGAAPFHAVDEYVYSLGGSKTSLQITLTTTSGDADLYVLVNSTRGRAGPAGHTYDYAGVNLYGDDTITVSITDTAFAQHCPNFPAHPCPIGIGVLGSADFDSQYTLVGTTTGGIGPATQRLDEGVSVAATVQPNQYAYFTFPVVRQEVVIVSVTPTGSGDPDVYLYTNTSLPTAGGFSYASHQDGFDIITVQPFPGAPDACPQNDQDTCTYTIGVTPHPGSGAASFNIMVRTDDGQAGQLQPGQRVRSTVQQGQAVLYYMQLVNANYEHIEVNLNSLVGDADLFVTLDGTNPTVHHWQYASLSPAADDYVYIHKTDEAYVQFCGNSVACPVRVLVAGFRNTTYDLVASTNDSPVQLTAGQAVYDHVAEDKYDYFQFTTHVPHSNLRFVLSAFSGDADMVVGRGDRGQMRPTLSNRSSYDWSSTWNDLDIVEIDHNDPNACTASCTYFVGVVGDGGASSFAIAVSEANDTFLLVDGQTVFGFVSPHTTAQALWVVERSPNPMTVVVNPISGDPDLYVNVGAGRPAPSAAGHDYASISTDGKDEVRMKWTDQPFLDNCPTGDDCAVRVGVQGFSSSYFYLTASSSLYTRLLENVPVQGNVAAGGYTYFSFDVANENAVVFALTALAGDPDMYINSNNTFSPSPGHRDFAETSLSGGALEIYPGDVGACTPPCTYFIGVTPFSGSASFSLLARTHTTTPTTLSDGRPQIDLVGDQQRNYYITQIPANKPGLKFEVSLVARSGDADMYAALGNYTLDKAHYQYLSVFTGRDTITFKGSDQFYQDACMHPGMEYCFAQIMVFGYTAAEYSITASNQGSLITLEEGLPVTEDASQDAPEHFTFAVEGDEDITFALTPLSGDADMYVSNALSNITRPSHSPGQWQWRSNGLGFESIFIDKDHPAAKACTKPCQYYITVEAFGGHETTFTLAASTGTPVLTPGIPVSGVADKGHFAYYSFTPGPDVTSFSLTVAGTRGSVAGYIGNTIDTRNGGLLKPRLDCTTMTCRAYTVKNVHWSTAASSGGTVTVDSSSPFWRQSQFIIGVLSPPGSGPDGSAFTVTVSTSDSITTLADGSPVYGSVMAGEYNYYAVDVPDATDDLLLQVTSFSGDSDLLVSINPDNPFPNFNNSFDFFAFSYGNDSVYLTPGDLAPCRQMSAERGLAGCTVHASVLGFSDSQYSIVARAGAKSEIALVDGQPQAGFAPANGYAYYRAVVDFPQDALVGYEVTVTGRSGDPDLYVISTRDAEPSITDFDKRSIGFGRESVSFTPGTPYYNGSTVLHIAVFGWQTEAEFDIVFTTSGQGETLGDGKPTQVTLDAAGSAFFRFPMYTSTADLQYAIATLSGDVDFYITRPDNDTSSSIPGPDNYIWSGTATGGGVAGTIRHTDPKFLSGVEYTFGLYNPSTVARITVTIVAHVSTTIVSLTDGASQLGGVGAGDYEYFTYTCGVSCTWQDLTISATPSGSGSVRVVATDLYTPGGTGGALPTLEHNVWSSDSGVGPDPFTIVIPAGDPLHTAGHTTFTIGVVGMGAPAAFNVLVSSSEVPTMLRIGTPSARVSVDAGDTKHFVTYVDDTSVDLIVTVTPLSGDPDILVSARNSNPYCVLPTASRRLAPWAAKGTGSAVEMASDVATVSDTVGSKLRTCYGARWFTSSAGSNAADLLTINAAAPCEGPNVNSTDCVPALDWRPGLFYIGVFAQTTTQFSLTLYSDGLTTLNGGQTAQGQAGSLHPVYFMFGDQGVGEAAQHDLKVTITRTSDPTVKQWPLVVYMNSCRQSQCTTNDRHPSAGHFAPNGVLQVTSDRNDFFITPADALSCVPEQDDECQYFFAVSALCPGSVHAFACQQSFFIAVTVQDGDSVETVPFSQINGRVGVLQGSAPISTSPKFETFLGGEPSTVQMRLDSCGVDYAGVYVCDPTAAAAAACADAFNPSPADNTHGNMSSASTGGSARVTVSDTSATALYVGVANGGSPSPLQVAMPGAGVVHTHLGARSRAAAGLEVGATAPVYEFELDVYTDSAYILTLPAQSAVTVGDTAGSSASVTWQPAVVVQGSSGTVVALPQAEYTVYAGKGGFGTTSLAQGIPTTPCGLERWFAQLGACDADASASPHCGSVVARAATGENFVQVGGLSPGEDYEFTVMVTCDVGCWAAAFSANASGNHAEQRVVYPATTPVNSGSAAGRSGAPKALAPGVTAVIVISALLGVAAIAAFVWWRYRQAARAQGQYTVLAGETYGIQAGGGSGSATAYGQLVDDDTAGGEVEFRDRLAQYLDQ